MKRQPASILKPLAVYLPALTHNILSPASLILDEEINYNGFCPKNADKAFHGFVSAKNAVANSYNIPSVKTLDCLGVKKSRDMLSNLGININNSDLNLSLALGAVSNGVKILDLITAYNTIANYGIKKDVAFVSKILDKNGKTVYSHEEYSERVAEEDSCFLLTEMLKETAKTGTAKKLESLNLPLASKTGTANDGRNNTDLYNVTYSTEHTILTWIANIKDNKLPTSILSSGHPTEINKQICEHLYSNGVVDFVKPEGVEKFAYDLNEYENNHIIVKPKTNLERYIAHDYFKIDNCPIELKSDAIELDIKLTKLGAEISFTPNQYDTYYLYRIENENQFEISKITNQDQKFYFCDSDVFNYNQIYYVLKKENEIVSTSENIRPKDFLMSMLNNNILSGKYKWYV